MQPSSNYFGLMYLKPTLKMHSCLRITEMYSRRKLYYKLSGLISRAECDGEIGDICMLDWTACHQQRPDVWDVWDVTRCKRDDSIAVRSVWHEPHDSPHCVASQTNKTRLRNAKCAGQVTVQVVGDQAGERLHATPNSRAMSEHAKRRLSPNATAHSADCSPRTQTSANASPAS